jgi:hypothetical protein
MEDAYGLKSLRAFINSSLVDGGSSSVQMESRSRSSSELT